MLVHVIKSKGIVFDGVNFRPRTFQNLSSFLPGTLFLAPGVISPARFTNNSVFPTGTRFTTDAPNPEIKPAVFTNTSVFPVGVPSSGATRIVAVANGGADAATRVTSSLDLSTWHGPDTMPTFDNGSGIAWESIAYSPELGLWVALGQGAAQPQHLIATSPDGITWTQRTSSAAGTWNAVIWVADLNLFVAVGSGGLVQTSPDGITWTARTASQANDWRALAYSHSLGLIVAVASNGTNRVMTSPDGINWTNRTAANAGFWVGVAWSPSLAKFCAIANSAGTQIMHSTDGITWTNPSYTGISTFIWERIIWAGPSFNKFVICSANGAAIARSSDGTTWTQVASINTNQQIEDVIWHSAQSLLIYAARTGTGNRIQSSPDGTTWTNLSAPDRDYRALGFSLFQAASGNQFVVAPAPAQFRPQVFNNTSTFPTGTTVSVAPADGFIRPSRFTNGSTFPSGNTVSQRLTTGEVTTQYTNEHGQGDRRANVTVTARAGLFDQKDGGSFSAGDESVLIDGDLGSLHELRFAAGITDGWIKFDFSHGTVGSSTQERVIDEIRLWMVGLTSMGNWQMFGSHNDSSYTALGSAFDFHGASGIGGGGSATQFPFTNTNPWLYYKLVQQTGTTVASHPKEFDFKIRAYP
jgi:hypothetical protein